ncbi:predicted protein [Clostridium sp. CAG:167]|nr:predicted protein [Clostridium sp. CAG:167]
MASSNRSLTREAPTPTNISTKSEPEILKNGTPASPATAFASNVLPVPGGPTMITPFGILAPSLVYFSGSARKSTISSNCSFSSTKPATSANVFALSSGVVILARLFPKFIILELPPPPCDCELNMLNRKNSRINPTKYGRTVTYHGVFCTSFTTTLVKFTLSI